tara:strand:+ start:622 stop:1008 length:387 start_codon:yes stop_codon:yes gene_type:complete
MALTLKTAAFYHNQRGGPWGVNQQANKIQEMMLNSDYNLIGWRRILASQLTEKMEIFMRELNDDETNSVGGGNFWGPLTVGYTVFTIVRDFDQTMDWAQGAWNSYSGAINSHGADMLGLQDFVDGHSS